MRGLQNTVGIVAGGGSGIGAAAAIRLAEEGASMVVGDVAGDNAVEIADRITAAGGNAVAATFDITDEQSVAALIGTAVRHFGGLDHIHVNAADLQIVKQDTNAVDIPLDVFDRTMAVNLRGHLLCARHAIPEMQKRGGGALVFTSSTGAFAGEPERIAYAASKSALGALVRHIASRWGKENIRANGVAPGLVFSDYVRKNLRAEREEFARNITRSARLGEPEDIAAAVAFLCSKDGEWINGQVISVDGGASMRP